MVEYNKCSQLNKLQGVVKSNEGATLKMNARIFN